MNKRYTNLIVIAIIAIGAGGAYIVSDSFVPTTPAPIVQNTTEEAASVGITAITTNRDANTAAAGDTLITDTRIIRWESRNFPNGATVNVNLIRKISDNPIKYEFVKSLGMNIANTGNISWTPGQDEISEQSANLYIEVVCANADSLKNGCNVSTNPIKVF